MLFEDNNSLIIVMNLIFDYNIILIENKNPVDLDSYFHFQFAIITNVEST